MGVKTNVSNDDTHKYQHDNGTHNDDDSASNNTADKLTTNTETIAQSIHSHYANVSTDTEKGNCVLIVGDDKHTNVAQLIVMTTTLIMRCNFEDNVSINVVTLLVILSKTVHKTVVP